MINLQNNPLNCIETSLGNLYGSDPQGIRIVAQKIRNGLGHEGFVVIKTDQVDRLRALLLSIYTDQDDDVLKEAHSILEGWK